jgi:hypothetical protein
MFDGRFEYYRAFADQGAHDVQMPLLDQDFDILNEGIISCTTT